MNLKDTVTTLEAAKEAAVVYAIQFKTSASSEGLENIADDFMAGVKWALAQQSQQQPEVSEETIYVSTDGEDIFCAFTDAARAGKDTRESGCHFVQTILHRGLAK